MTKVTVMPHQFKTIYIDGRCIHLLQVNPVEAEVISIAPTSV